MCLRAARAARGASSDQSLAFHSSGKLYPARHAAPIARCSLATSRLLAFDSTGVAGSACVATVPDRMLLGTLAAPMSPGWLACYLSLVSPVLHCSCTLAATWLAYPAAAETVVEAPTDIPIRSTTTPWMMRCSMLQWRLHWMTDPRWTCTLLQRAASQLCAGDDGSNDGAMASEHPQARFHLILVQGFTLEIHRLRKDMAGCQTNHIR